MCGTSFHRAGGSGINKLPNRKYKLFDPKAESVASDQLMQDPDPGWELLQGGGSQSVSI